MATPDVAIPRHAVPDWTTAALLAKGTIEIEQWHGEGYLAADMETGCTFAIAEYFGMRRGSLLYPFDNPRQGLHLEPTEADKDAAPAEGERAIFDLLFALIEANRGELTAGQSVPPDVAGMT